MKKKNRIAPTPVQKQEVQKNNFVTGGDSLNITDLYGVDSSLEFDSRAQDVSLTYADHIQTDQVRYGKGGFRRQNTKLTKSNHFFDADQEY